MDRQSVYAVSNYTLNLMNFANRPAPSLEFHYIMNMSRDVFLTHLKSGYIPPVHYFVEPGTTIPGMTAFLPFITEAADSRSDSLLLVQEPINIRSIFICSSKVPGSSPMYCSAA